MNRFFLKIALGLMVASSAQAKGSLASALHEILQGTASSIDNLKTLKMAPRLPGKSIRIIHGNSEAIEMGINTRVIGVEVKRKASESELVISLISKVPENQQDLLNSTWYNLRHLEARSILQKALPPGRQLTEGTIYMPMTGRLAPITSVTLKASEISERNLDTILMILKDEWKPIQDLNL